MRISGNTFCSIAVAVVLSGACGDGLSAPLGAERFDPPAVYTVLWGEVETCAGVQGSMSVVHWYVVPKTLTFPCEYGACRGLWVAPHSIYLSDAAAHDTFFEEFFTVKHEILHDLVGAPGHPPVFQQCGLLRDEAPG